MCKKKLFTLRNSLHSPLYHSNQSSFETRPETAQALRRSSVSISFLPVVVGAVGSIGGGSWSSEYNATIKAICTSTT